MYLILVIDDQTDVESAPAVRELTDIMLDALNDPNKPRPEGEAILGLMVKESVMFHTNALASGSLPSSSICSFCERAFKIATPSATRHFLESFAEYLESNVDQARDRDNDTIAPFEGFLEMRRTNTVGRAMFFIGEQWLNVPDEAYYHPVIRELQNYACDMAGIENVSGHSILLVTRAMTIPPSFIQDIESYNKEQALGEVYRNIVTVLMRQFDIGPQEAINRAYECHRDIQRKFIRLLDEVPSFGLEADTAVSDYIFHLAYWVQGIMCWGFESGRYFGDKGLDVQRDGWVDLLPKVKTSSVGS